MTKTKYYDLQMDDPQDDYDVDVVNANLKKIDEQMKTRENATDALQEPEFTVAAKRENIASKEKMPKILGKIAKFFADLKAVAFTGNYNDLSDKPTSLPANGGNSDTVNSHTVESNVPKNAKFTDTTYSDATTTTHGLMSATDKKLLDVLNKPLATCATGRATAAKVATLQNFTLQVGSTVVVKFTGTGTANPTSGNLTLNVNGTGARIMGYFRNGNKAAISYVSGNFFCSNATHIFTYDGTYWLCMDWNLDNNTTYSDFVKSGTGAKAGLVPAPSTTAGTTKYLREDGAWKTPPDTKTSVVNNNTTTEPGSALDARQANPNIEGTMAANIQQINSNLTFENSPMVSKKYNLAKNGSITIPCLNCIIFFVGHLASHFLIATTVGYQSDSIRSRVSFVNGNEQIGVTIAYSKEDTLEAYSGKFTISNTRDSMDVIVIGIKNYSKV